MSTKPVIETMVNTCALALTSFGTIEITKANVYGFICILFGMSLEWFKYFGRHRKWW
jgi:hypothetical protein